MRTVTILAVAALLLLAAPLFIALRGLPVAGDPTAAVPADGQSGATDGDGEFERRAAEFIRNNPEVLVEALQTYQERAELERAAAASRTLVERRDELVRDPASPVGGNPDGGVTIVEFFDYNCGFCKRAVPTVAELLARNPDIRYVYKEFPILSESSRYAARAALAVHRTQPELYEALHRKLLGHRGTVTEQAVRDIADLVGVDVAQMLSEMNDPAIARSIEANLQLGRAIGVTGTPSFVIGDRVVAGAQPLAELEEAVKSARSRGS